MSYSINRARGDRSTWLFVAAALLLFVPELSFAQASSSGFSLPFISGIGCDVVKWMKGELAVIVFLIVCVAAFLVGLFSRMDWTKILVAVILFGLLQGIVGILLSTGTVQVPSCFN